MIPPAFQTFDPLLEASAACEVAGAAALSADGMRCLQEARLRRLLRTACRDSAWYRHHLGGREPDRELRLQDLPVARKADLMAHFDQWVTDPVLSLAHLRRFTADRTRIGQAYGGRYVVWSSSGSSGEPGIFVQDRAAMAVYDALQALRQPHPQPHRRWLDPLYATERIAFVGATGEHAASTVWLERMRRLNPFVAASVQSLSFLQPRADLMDALQRLRPTVLSTYPGVAVQLAEEAASGRLHLPLKEVRTGGENLTPAARRFVAEAFGCSVINSYGASEFFCIAFECRLGCLHLNSDWVILEPVDDRGQPVPRGQAGHTTLLTNLANHVQPLIRYDLGDRVGIQAAACGCGSVLPVVTVDGRCDDSLRLGGSRNGGVSIDPLALTSLLEDEAGLFDFQLVQRGPLELELRMPPSSRAGGSSQRAAGMLAAFLARQGAGKVRIVCTGVPPLPAGANCKTRRVVALPR